MLFKKLLRTLKQYKSQFISMVIMIAIGTGIFIGFNMEWYSIKVNTDTFYEETNFADFRIINAKGFSKDDLDKIKAISGVDNATRYLSVNTSVEGSDKIIALTVSENMELSSFILYNETGESFGEEYNTEETEGIWLSDKYALKNNLKVGDAITLKYEMFTFKFKIVGLIKSSEYLVCLPDETQLMPDYNTHGYGYITPKALDKCIGMEYYTQINIKSNLSKQELSDKIDKALGSTTIILSKDDIISYSGPSGEIEEGKTMCSVLPVLFLAIAILTMITTMHRLVINEKTQIGILKALGFKDYKVVIHYTSFSTFIGILGSIFGIGIGYFVAYYIMNPNGAMGTYIDMPNWHLYMPWFGWLLLVLINVLLTFVGYLSVKNMLKGNTADALRSYTPKKMKSLLLEKTKLWSKFGFGTRWNLRDIMRHKARSFMTLIGIVGCTILVIGSLGMKDTMNEFVDKFYDEAINYETRLFVSEKTSNEDAIEEAKKYSGDFASITNVKVKDKTYPLEIYNITHDMVKFVDLNGKIIKLGEKEVYISKRLAEEYDIKENDYIEFSPYQSSTEYKVKVTKIIRSLSESIIMSTEYAKSINYDYKINVIYTNQKDIEASNIITSTQSKSSIIKSFDTFTNLLNVMVLLLMVAALILGAIVLYNLGIMSYMERYREMATLKVVGFKDKKIGNLLISQNLWIATIGVLLGIPFGVITLKYLAEKLASEYEMKIVVNALTYILTIILTVLMSFVVSLITFRKNKKINMVESLKGID